MDKKGYIMANILDYIRWRGDLTFDKSSLNEVDSLILAELSYLNFESIAQNSEGVSLDKAAGQYFAEERDKQKNTGDLQKPDYFSMLKLMADSERFSNILLSNYVQEVDTDKNMQFSAVTFQLNKDLCYLAYRGTDDTLLGWKEDFLMSVMDTVPSQAAAVRYLKWVMEAHSNCKWYIGGHSKGGNLAVYAATNAGEAKQKQILGVFNHDGPGFKESIVQTKEYEVVRRRIYTSVAQSSIVGMLLEHDENYTVVQSLEKGAMQHDGFSWEVCGTQFIHLESVTKESRIADMTIRRILSDMSDEQRRQFTESLFSVLAADKNRTLTDIRMDGFRAVRAMLKTYDHLDKASKKALQSMVMKMLSEGFKNMQER